jgi:uncharacterized protein
MHLSRSAIVAPVSGSDRLLLVQPLTGEVALFEGEEASSLRGITAEQPLPSALPLADMRAAGFAVESEDDERSMLAEAYANYLERDRSARRPNSSSFPPSGCNLSCTYCYQEPFVGGASGLIAPETIAALFAYIDRFHGQDQPRPYLTLFGGEPLMNSPAHHDRVGRLDGWRR